MARTFKTNTGHWHRAQAGLTCRRVSAVATDDGQQQRGSTFPYTQGRRRAWRGSSGSCGGASRGARSLFTASGVQQSRRRLVRLRVQRLATQAGPALDPSRGCSVADDGAVVAINHSCRNHGTGRPRGGRSDGPFTHGRTALHALLHRRRQEVGVICTRRSQ